MKVKDVLCCFSMSLQTQKVATIKNIGRHVDTIGNLAMSQFQGLLSLYFFWVVWFPSNFQEHTSREKGNPKLHIGMNQCVPDEQTDDWCPIPQTQHSIVGLPIHFYPDQDRVGTKLNE